MASKPKAANEQPARAGNARDSKNGGLPPPRDGGLPPPRLARGPVALSLVMGRVTRPVLGKRGFVGAEILTHWSAIVGVELAVFACPLQVKYPRGRNASATLI